MDELRRLFDGKAVLLQRASDLHHSRLTLLRKNCGAVRLDTDETHPSRLIVHLVPLRLDDAPQIDLSALMESGEELPLLGGTAPKFRGYNLHGAVSTSEQRDVFDDLGEQLYEGREPLKDVRSYTQLFRDGVIEAVRTNVCYEDYGSDWVVDSTGVADELIGLTDRCSVILEHLGVSAPVVLYASLLGVSRAVFSVGYWPHLHSGTQIADHHDEMTLPAAVVQNFSVGADGAADLRPVLDGLWNAAGLPHWKPVARPSRNAGEG